MLVCRPSIKTSTEFPHIIYRGCPNIFGVFRVQKRHKLGDFRANLVEFRVEKGPFLFLLHLGILRLDYLLHLTNQLDLGLFCSGFFLLLCGYFGTDTVTAIVFLTLGVGLQGMVVAGHNVNNLDIAPRYSGIIMGITNMFGTFPGFLGPQLAKAVAKKVSSFIQLKLDVSPVLISLTIVL